MTDLGQQAPLAWSELTLQWSQRQSFERSYPSDQIQPGETLLLTGESGAGKTTLLSALCGLKPPSKGRITACGQDLYALSAAKRDMFRARNFGVIFQQLALLPYADILSNILLPLRFQSYIGQKDQTAEKRARTLCAALGLTGVSLSQKVATLSQGQQQRVAIARALIGQPALILADEPTAALDNQNRDLFLDLLFKTAAQDGTALLIASHDQTIQTRFDRVLALNTPAATEAST